MTKSKLAVSFILVSTFISCGFDYEKDIIETIISHYKSEYSKEKNCGKVTIRETEDGTEVESAFIDTDDSFSISICGYHLIPKASGLIRGDINGDGNDDVIVPVSSNGGGTAVWDDLFFFLSDQKTLASYIMFNSSELASCGNGGGKFEVKAIAAAFIVGESQCYAEDDPSCCPSLKYKTEYKLQGEKLVLVGQ